MKHKLFSIVNSTNLIKHILYKTYKSPERLNYLNITQEKILIALKNEMPSSMASIARYIGIEKGPFSQIIDKLEKLDLVTRNRDSTDRRLVFLKLTEKGTAVAQELEESMEKHFAEVLSVLSEEELDTLYSSLDNINKITNILITQKD